ncbi:MAG: D-ribose pyranase [Oscillospiraceae bacterium]
MLKQGILNSNLKYLLARCGHRDLLAVTDAGYNVPKGVEVVDLAFLPNVPGIEIVLKGVLEEIAVEKVYLAEEIQTCAPELLCKYKEIFGEIPIEFIPHTPNFDEKMKDVKGAIRTGQYWLHAPNCILQVGCTYD